MRRSSPHFSPMSRPASCPGVRSARSGPKSVSGNTVEARDAAGGRLGATRRAALSGRHAASRRLPDVPASRCAPLLACRPDSAAQTMTLVRIAGWPGFTTKATVRDAGKGPGPWCGAGRARPRSGSRHDAGEHTSWRGRRQDGGARGAAANGPARAPPRPLRGPFGDPAGRLGLSHLVSTYLGLSRLVSAYLGFFGKKRRRASEIRRRLLAGRRPVRTTGGPPAPCAYPA